MIEIDGGIHHLEGVRVADKARQNEIENDGWQVIRVDAETALSKDHLMAIVVQALGI